MKRVFFLVLSFCVAVVLIVSTAAPAFCATPYFITFSNFYTYRDQLPFGYDTIVVDIEYDYASSHQYVNRYFLPPGCTYWVEFSSDNTSYTLNAIFPDDVNLAYRFSWKILTNAYMTQTFSLVEWNSTSQQYLYSHTQRIYSFSSSDSIYYHANIYRMVDSVANRPIIYAYPTRDSADVTTIVRAVNDAASSLNQQELSRYRAQMTQESQNHQQDMTQRSQQHAQDMTQRSQQHSEIMHAGSDEPTLDTDIGWMDDSLSKVNSWLDDLSNFEGQMSANRAENAENMSRAGSFLSDFFGSLPASIIAAMALCLVVIVVVKIVGR